MTWWADRVKVARKGCFVPTTPRGLIARIFLATALSAPTGSVVARPLEAELADLVSSNPQIRAQEAAFEGVRKEITRAQSAYYPQVDVSGNIGPTHIETDQRTELGLGAFDKTQKVAGVTIAQNLFDGFETPSNVRIARMNAEVARFTLEGTRQEVLLQGIEAYLNVLRQKRLVELAEQNEDSIRLQTDLEDERVERGAGIAVDVLQSKARLQIAKEQRVGFEGSFQDTISRYIQIFNHAPELAAMTDPAPPEPMLPRTVDEAVEVAINESPAVGASLSTIEVASERRSLARSGYFPRLEVIGAANYEDDFDLRPGVRTDYSILLQATWNLFNGFRTSATVEQAAYDYRASQENHEVVARNVVQQTRVVWQALQTARDRQDLLANAVVIAEEAFIARRRLRESGRETVINVLLAENEVNNARINLTNAEYDALVASYRILQRIGRLNPQTLGLRSR